MNRNSAGYWLERRLPVDFFRTDVHELSRNLLGKHVVRVVDDALRVGRLVEVEAYGGEPDPACHGDSGSPTERTEPMFGRGGRAYVYVIYGMYDCLNVVADPPDVASAVLIRAAEPVIGEELMAAGRGIDSPIRTMRQRWKLMSGPGKLCQALDVTKDRFNGETLDGTELFFADGEDLDSDLIATTQRIGLNPKTCGESAMWEWRYVDRDSDFLSRPL